MVEREWFDKDYYKVLGLTSSATEKEITRAYRKLAKSSHPDTNPGIRGEVQRGLGRLRRARGQREAQGVRRGSSPRTGRGRIRRSGRSGRRGFNFQTGDFGDLGDLFGGLFGGGRRQRAQRGADLETALHLGFPRRRHGRDDVGEPAEQRGVPHLQGEWRRARHRLRHLRTLRWTRRAQRRPGTVRDVERLPGLSGSRRPDRDAVSDLSRHRSRAVLAQGERAHSRRRQRRATHQDQGQGQSRHAGRSGRRPLRRRARVARRALRSPGSQRDDDGQRPAHRGDARHHGRGADAG